MRFRSIFILLIFPAILFAQPGPFGGFTMSFRVYSPKGDMILCGDKAYRVFPTYTGYPTGRYGNTRRRTVDTFHCYNSRFEFTFQSTPVGGNIPDDFLINIIHGKDTMQISDGFQMDSIPFRKGRFRFNTHSISLYEIKKKNHVKVNNLDWELMEAGQKIEHPHISFLYEGGLIPDNFSWGINIEKSPDGKGLIALGQNSDDEVIWKCNSDIYWSKPFEYSSWKLRHLIATAPPEFKISGINFMPHIGKVNKSSWAEEPLLSFYGFSEMHFVNQKIAYMMLEGKIYKTSDEGNTWNQIVTGDKHVSKLYYNKNQVYAVFSTNEFARINSGDSVLHLRSFKSGTNKSEIYSMQFQNDSIAYFLINSGNEGGGKILYRAVNDKISRKPLLRFLPYSSQLIIAGNSVILWFGEKNFWKSNDGGVKWNYFDNKEEYANDVRYSERPVYYKIISVYTENGILKALTQHTDGSMLYGKILLDEDPGYNEKREADEKIWAIETKIKNAKDSSAYCNCLTYGLHIKYNRQIENGTYYRTELKFLLDRVPAITLQDGEFWYNPQGTYKEIHYASESIPETRGTYVANEQTITFSSEDDRNYLNGTFNYFFDGHNFRFYHCDKSKGFGDIVDFYNFDRDSAYHPPVLKDTVVAVFRDHASNHIYSFTPDSEKFVITLFDTSGRWIENASLKLDDVYAMPMQQDYMYYFDKRTFKEFHPQPGGPLLLIISHPDFEPLVTEFSENITKYILKRKKKK